MPMDERRQKWMDAFKRLAQNPDEKIRCPDCGQYWLIVEDEEVDVRHIDRHVFCPECTYGEHIYMDKPSKQK
jgi:transcription elongation factor Elf1